MPFRLFIVIAIVLIVFGIIAAAGTGTLFGTLWYVWFMASFLSFLVDVAIGGWGYANGRWGRGGVQPPVA